MFVEGRCDYSYVASLGFGCTGVTFARSCLVLIVMKVTKSGTFSSLLKECMVLVEISMGEPCFNPVRPTRRCLAPSRTEPYR